MDVNILDLQMLFATPIRYEIPMFQRPYVWNHEDQWDPLWEDVQNTAEHYLEQVAAGNTPSKATGHFLGTVVLQQQQVSTPMLMTRLVVDGQQRLTTLQLLLDAVQEVFEQRAYDNAAMRLQILVLNQEAFRQGNSDHAFKVWPTMADQDAFRYTMDNKLHSDEFEQSLVVQAHDFFKSQTRQWLDGRPEDNGASAEALEQAITHLLRVVVIDLEASDDPHVIFETLNARGTPLLQSDLIKNMVLHEAVLKGFAIDATDELRLWDFKDQWWRQEIRQGRTVRPRIDVFLNYWMIMRTRDEVAGDDVFSVFRRYYDRGSVPIEKISADINLVGSHYEALEKVSKPDLETFLYRRGVMQAGTLTPVLLWLLSSDVPKPQLDKGIRALESHQLRRMVCRWSTMGNNRLFNGLIALLEEAGPQHAGNTIVEYLGNQTSNVGKWPDNLQLENAFISQPLYKLLTRGRLRIVLEGIEEGMRTAQAESQSAPRNLTIEHIMPRHWREHWRLPDGMENEFEAAARRDELIHSIGNLTLVNHKLNPTLSNDRWDYKRETLGKHSVLFLNKLLIEEYSDVWDEVTIAERAKKLSSIAAIVWPHADNM